MLSAEDEDEVVDELSTALHHLYRLHEWCRKKLALEGRNIHSELQAHPEVRATIWMRGEETHDDVVVGHMADSWSDYYSDLYGTLVWAPVGNRVDKWGHGRHIDYRNALEGKAVPDSLRRVFTVLAAL